MKFNKDIKRLAARIGMTNKSTKELLKMDVIQYDMTDLQVASFLVNKDRILNVIASQYTGFKRVMEIPERLILVNEDGVVMDGLSGKVFKPFYDEIENNKAYLCVQILANGRAKNYKVHRLVSEYFCENQMDKDIVHHKADRFDNRAENLLYVSQYEHSLIHRLRRKSKNLARMLENAINADNGGRDWTQEDLFK